MIKTTLAIMLITASLASAQDKKSLKDLEGTWEFDGAQLRVELKNDEMRLYINAGGQRREIRAPYQNGVSELATGSYLVGRISNYKSDEARGSLGLTVDCRGQGTPSLSSTGMLENVKVQLAFVRAKENAPRGFSMSLGESVREGMAMKNYSKNYSLKK